jgi:hypothetical protein
MLSGGAPHVPGVHAIAAARSLVLAAARASWTGPEPL